MFEDQKNYKTLFIVYYRLDIGGIQTKIIDIINYLARQRPQLQIILVLREKRSTDRLNEIKNAQASILYYPDTVWSKLPLCFPLFMLGLAFQHKPDAILAFTFIPALCAIWVKFFILRRIAVVLSEDWSTPDELGIDLAGNFSIMRRLAFYFFYHKADAICTVNNQITSVLIDKYHIPPTKIYRVINWFSPTQQHRVRKTTVKQYDLIYVGRLENIKNIAFLLVATRKIIAVRPLLKLCIVGTGTQEQILKQYVIDNGLTGNISFAGFSSDPGKHLIQSKIFVLASSNEGLPLAVLEAMSNKLPVVSFNYPGVSEVVKNGYNGYVYRTEKEFIHYLTLLLSSSIKRRKLGTNGFSLVQNEFSIKNINQYIELLRI